MLRSVVIITNFDLVKTDNLTSFFKYELYFQPTISNCSLRIPVTSEQEVYELAHRLGNDENFQRKLGMEIINQRQFADSKETGVRSIIRRMMKEIICEDMCNRMNTTGRSSKLSANCDGGSVKAIKTPDSIMRFLAKFSALLTNTNEEDTYCEVKKVITRWISDERNNKFLRKNRRLKQRIERQMLTMVGNQSQVDSIICIPPSTSHHLMNPILVSSTIDSRHSNKREHRESLITHIGHL
ncbi:hypothetical protein PVAND_001553 [Polypedilum vanderplanki]|uniref:Uncharacterized protein n=1 Tax=Polypedilum vanderplanki TaxID=319348 RepID=A0A9J6BNS0_POLVA|nr:hypothetical protein PVAND_001553 [Polypedilum vanderplanki]